MDLFPKCICGYRTDVPGTRCGPNCDFTLNDLSRKAQDLRNAAEDATVKYDKYHSSFDAEDLIEGEELVKRAEQAAWKEVKEIRDKMEKDCQNKMKEAFKQVQEIRTEAEVRCDTVLHESAREVRTHRTKSIKAHQDRIRDQWSDYESMNVERTDLLAKAHALEVYNMLVEPGPHPPSYGPDVTGTKWGKGGGKDDADRGGPYDRDNERDLRRRDPNAGRPSGSRFTDNDPVRPTNAKGTPKGSKGSKHGKSFKEIRLPNVQIDDPHDEECSGVTPLPGGQFERVNLKRTPRCPVWDNTATGCDGETIYYDGHLGNDYFYQKQVEMDLLIESQRNETENDVSAILERNNISLKEYHLKERVSLRTRVTDTTLLSKFGWYPHYMWHPDHFSQLFERRMVIKAHNSGPQRFMAVIQLPRGYRPGLQNPMEEDLVGVSSYTARLKGIPGDFFEGVLIKKLLEYGPLCSFYLEREDEAPFYNTGIAYLKFIYHSSLQNLMADWWSGYIGGGWGVKDRMNDRGFTRIFADYSMVELITPGYPIHHRDGNWNTGPEAPYCLPLGFRLPRHHGEFTKDLLEVAWLYNKDTGTGNTFTDAALQRAPGGADEEMKDEDN